jgi:hypothetical protein
MTAEWQHVQRQLHFPIPPTDQLCCCSQLFIEIEGVLCDGCLPTQVGFESFGTDLPEDVSQEDLLKVVADYNADPKVSQHAVLFGWCMPC